MNLSETRKANPVLLLDPPYLTVPKSALGDIIKCKIAHMCVHASVVPRLINQYIFFDLHRVKSHLKDVSKLLYK